MDRFACLLIQDLPLAAVLRAEPELAGKRVAITEPETGAARRGSAGRGRSQQSPAIIAGFLRGLTVAQARAAEPDLVVRVFSLEGMRSAELALVDVASSISPRVMVAASGLVFIDLAGTDALFPSERGLLTALETRLTDVGLAGIGPASARLGIGPTRTVAELASRHREGGRILSSVEAASFLVPLPLDLLDPKGDLADRLSRWGVRTLGKLARLPREPLGTRLGEAGVRLARRANGEDLSPFRVHPPELRFEEGVESEWAIANLEPLAFFLRGALDRLLRRLRVRGFALRRLRLEFGLESGAVFTRELGLAAPTLETNVLLALVRLSLEAEPPPEGVLRALLVATPDSVETAQLDLFLPPLPSPGELAITIARIEALCGPGKVGSPCVQDTHLQDAATLAEFTYGGTRRGAARATPTSPGYAGLRASLAAPDSDDPSPYGVMALRAVRPPRSVGVRGGEPPVYVSLVADATLESEGGRVRNAAGPWRIFGEWWGESRFARDYWDVELSDGGVYRLYHNLPDDSWFVDGVYD
ncbi:MAG: DNA polymerase Y family protein [Myxococcota bacterium]